MFFSAPRQNANPTGDGTNSSGGGVDGTTLESSELGIIVAAIIGGAVGAVVIVTAIIIAVCLLKQKPSKV